MRNLFVCTAISSAIFASTVLADPIADTLSGKTLVASGQELTAHADGRLIGKVGKNLDVDLVGTWEIKGDQWCRTLTKPKGAAGTACQDITLGDGTATIVGNNGPVEYTLN